MTLSDALRLMANKSGLTYAQWGERAGGVAYSTISSPIDRNDMKVSTLVRLADVAGYDLLLLRRPDAEGRYGRVIILDRVGRDRKPGRKQAKSPTPTTPPIYK